MLIESSRSRLVVIGHHQERGARLHFVSVANEIECFFGGIGASPRDYRYAAGRSLDDNFHDASMFFVRERGGFPGGSTGNETVGARLDLVFDQRLQAGFIDFPLPEWCDQ